VGCTYLYASILRAVLPTTSIAIGFADRMCHNYIPPAMYDAVVWRRERFKTFDERQSHNQPDAGNGFDTRPRALDYFPIEKPRQTLK